LGATTFYEISRGETAQEAFSVAVQNAQHMHGHSGYTGTIAEKQKFLMASPKILPQEEAHTLAKSLIEHTFYPRTTYSEYTDRWGAAGCIRISTHITDKTKTFLFFGWASN
jgi:hypothetical protein